LRRSACLHATALKDGKMIGIGPSCRSRDHAASDGPQAIARLGRRVVLIHSLVRRTSGARSATRCRARAGCRLLRQGYGEEKVGRLMGFSLCAVVVSGPSRSRTDTFGVIALSGIHLEGSRVGQSMLPRDYDHRPRSTSRVAAIPGGSNRSRRSRSRLDRYES